MLRLLQIATAAGILMIRLSTSLPAQSPTTGRIAGTVSDPTGAVVGAAEVIAVDIQTGEKHSATTNAEGNYAFPFLPPGIYRVEFRADGFSSAPSDNVRVFITETATLNVRLRLAAAPGDTVNVLAEASPPNGPQLGRVVDSETVSELPQATRNFTQILALSPGTSVGLADNTALGRNSQNISVNGARVTQNDFQINGIDANGILTNSASAVAVPAPETIQEFKVQTSLYDAAFGRGAGGSVQTITRSGGNTFHGALYDYFRNEALNANDPFLKAAQVARPILRRNVLGVLAGGPVRKDKSFFFVSYQATRDRNGGSENSRSDVPVAQGLTDDRSEQTLVTTFNSAINPVSLALLNAKLPNGKFLIPTPQANGRYVGVDVSTYREDQFNINADHQLGPADRLSVKFFYSNAPQFFALPDGGANVPGFGADRKQDNRLLSIQYVRAFSSRTVNEARAGYNVIRGGTFGRQPVRDVDFGIRRANAAAYPGLGLISIGKPGLAIGNAGTSVDQKGDALSVTLADTISISRGKHDIRTGVGTVFYRDTLTTNNNRRGQIQFKDFNDFLVGKASKSIIGDGINSRRLRFADYSFFLQDDWAVSSRLTFNLGLRYELNLPPLEKDGLIATFDPNLYKPGMMDVDAGGVPIGPPAEGFVQAGNVAPSLDSPSIPNVGNRVFKSIDPNNIAPRVGFAYVPPLSTRLLVRGGYGIFYSRLSAIHIPLSINSPPFYAVSSTPPGGTVPSFENPYYPLPSQDQFPLLVKDLPLSGQMFDRGIRTPYFHQYNFSVEWKFTEHLQFEAAYAGSRGLDLLRGVPINYSRLASPQQPITNAVTGQVITTNSPDSANVALRAPYQGVQQLVQIQSSGQSRYNSLQVSLAHRKFKGLQFLASYTYSKSMDNGSGGSASTGAVFETEPARGANPLDPRSNRGLSNFDRTHRFVTSYIWKLPGFTDPRFPALRKVLSNWQLAGIVPVMSGLPIEILDGASAGVASFYGSSTWRPNWAAGADRRTAMTNIPPGYFFNPSAFTRPIVQANQPIPSSGGLAIASDKGTDFGDVGRNVLRGPAQSNVDIALTRRFQVAESSTAEFRVEFFNLFNHVNFANPISNVSNATAFSNTGVILAPGDFGRILSASSNPRLIQLALKLNW
jgi:hypothetical protein